MITYTVKFTPGRYKITPNKSPDARFEYFLIGREDDGHIVAFAFEENHAKQICYALNLAWACLSGDYADQKQLLAALEKLKGEPH